MPIVAPPAYSLDPLLPPITPIATLPPHSPVAHYHPPPFSPSTIFDSNQSLFCLEKEKEISYFGRLGNKQTNKHREIE